MILLPLIVALSSNASAQEPPAPSNLAIAELDGHRGEDLAIGSPTGCGEVGVWLSSDGPLPLYDRYTTPLREPSITLVPSACVPEFGAWLYLRDGDLIVRTAAGEHTISGATLSRARGTLVVDVADVTPPPLEASPCDLLYGDGGETVVVCHDQVLPQCEPCCGDAPCCITDDAE